MSEALERAIRDLLITERSSERVAVSLCKRLNREAPSRKERKVFVQFLVQSGHYRDALELFANWFTKKIPIPLAAFVYTLYRAGFKPASDFLDELFSAHQEATEENRLAPFTAWEKLDPRFVSIKEASVSMQRELAKARKEKFLEKLEYLRTHRMVEEEEKLLDELIELYPDDQAFQYDKKNSRQRWARAVIARRAFDSFDEDASDTMPYVSEELLNAAEPIKKEMLRLAKLNPRLAYDFSIGLYFFDMYESAREVLRYAAAGLNVDWLHVELLYRTRRFVECLEAVTTLERTWSEDPETTFGTTYYRALALEGLGQTSSAAELLKSIVAIRPSYRSAHALLLKWGGT